MRLYSTYDAKSEIWSNPFTAMNDQVAQRMFDQAVLDADTVVGQSPFDFSVWAVGEFDQATGLVTAIEPKELVIDGQQATANYKRRHQVGNLTPIELETSSQITQEKN